MATNKKVIQIVRENLFPDTIERAGRGLIRCQWGFFYNHGKTSEEYAKKVINLLTEKGIGCRIIADGMVWKDFKGGASTANQSHFYVIFEVL